MATMKCDNKTVTDSETKVTVLICLSYVYCTQCHVKIINYNYNIKLNIVYV